MHTMETPRLLLREFREDDYDDILAHVYADSDVWGMYSGIGDKPDEIRRRFLNRVYQSESAEFGFRAVELKATGRVIAQVHLEPHVLPTEAVAAVVSEVQPTPYGIIEVELAFAFGKAYWGQGYAYEACLPMIEYAFKELKLPRLVGGALAKNVRSQKLHERLGYTLAPDPTDPDFMIAALFNTL